MKLSRTLQIAVATAVCTAAATQPAFAGGHFRMVGEPKNEPPFTNPVGSTRQATAAVAASRSAVQLRMVDEPRNVPPFSVVVTHTAHSSGSGAPDAIARYLSH